MMRIRLIFITFFLCFPFFVCTAKNVAKSNKGFYDVIIYVTTDYHADANGIVFKILFKARGVNDSIEAKLHYQRESIDDKEDMNVFFIDVKYNKKVKKIKYLGTSVLEKIDIIDAQKTTDFCNKEYIVITIREQIGDIVPRNSVVELFLDFNKKNGDYSIFRYDNQKEPRSDGPWPFNEIRRETKQICHQDGIEFIYNAPYWAPSE